MARRHVTHVRPQCPVSRHIHTHRSWRGTEVLHLQYLMNELNVFYIIYLYWWSVLFGKNSNESFLGKKLRQKVYIWRFPPHYNDVGGRGRRVWWGLQPYKSGSIYLCILYWIQCILVITIGLVSSIRKSGSWLEQQFSSDGHKVRCSRSPYRLAWYSRACVLSQEICPGV